MDADELIRRLEPHADHLPPYWRALAAGVAASLPEPPEVTSDPSTWHPLNGPPEWQEWGKALAAAGTSVATGATAPARPGGLTDGAD